MKNKIIKMNERLGAVYTTHTGNLENNKEDAITLVALLIFDERNKC